MKKLIVAVVAFLFVAAPSALAAPSFSLVAPSTGIARGQNVQFEVHVDTAGSPITSSGVGMRYDTKYLKYVGVTAGDATTGVTATESSPGELVLVGQSNNFQGAGVYAGVTFNIIADAPGGTQVCSVFTPTDQQLAAAGVNGSGNGAQSRPDTLPQSGTAETTLLAVIAATFAISSGFLLRRHI